MVVDTIFINRNIARKDFFGHFICYTEIINALFLRLMVIRNATMLAGVLNNRYNNGKD